MPPEVLLQILLNQQKALLEENPDLNGQPLDNEIINALALPTLWYENGQYTVYIPESFRDSTNQIGGLNANNIALNADQDITNTGNIAAQSELIAAAENIINERRIYKATALVEDGGESIGVEYDQIVDSGAEIQADKVTFIARENIENTGGDINADSEVNLTVTNVINQAQEGQKFLPGVQKLSLVVKKEPGDMELHWIMQLFHRETR